jgi:O-antigen/teichoic acid export membrane protein
MIQMAQSIIEKGKNQLFRSKFTKSIIVITGGAAMAQVMNMFFSPIITRLYTPEEYGVMAVLSSILMILSFSSLMYDMAIPIDKEDSKAINTTALSVIILLIFTLTLTLSLFLKGNAVLDIFDADALVRYKYFVPLGVFLVGLHKILTQWMYRRKDFIIISKTRVGQNLLGNITKVTGGFLGLGASGLLLGKVIGESASIVPLGLNLIKREKNIIKNINRHDLLFSMKKHKNFPIYQTPSTFLSSLKNQLPVFSLALYGSQIVGLYGLANTIVKLPMTLVGHSVRNVFFAEAASIGKDNPKKLKSLSDKLFKKMVILGLFPLIALVVLGPQLFSLVFGSNWAGSGEIARFLAIAIYADFIFSPVSRVYEVLERQKEKMFIDLGGLLLVLLAFSIARVISESANFAIMLYSLSMFAFYLFTFIFARKYMNEEIRKQTIQ